jgi:hypothetical protein
MIFVKLTKANNKMSNSSLDFESMAKKFVAKVGI